MTVSNLAGFPVRGASRRARAERYRAESEAILCEVADCQRLLDATVASTTLTAYWQGQERARITIRSLGHLLVIDLPSILAHICAGLEQAMRLPLDVFSEQVAPELFAAVDDVRPDEVHLGDGREAAERLHYAWSLRSLLLQQVLATVNSSYSPPHFEDLASATAWISAYSSILQEAEAVLDETHALLHEEAIALQSFLDTTYARLARLEHDAHADGILLKRDWRDSLQRVEDEIIARLAQSVEELGRVTFETLTEARTGGWLESLALHTLRYAPRLGLLLLAVAGPSTAGRFVRDLPTSGVAARPAPPRAIQGTAAPADVKRHVELQRQDPFGVLPRRTVPTATAPASPGKAAASAVTAFFEALPKTHGRQTLHITNNGDLDEALRQLERFGYQRQAVLDLLGLASPEALTGELRLDLRMSAGGRPLLFPLTDETATQAVAKEPLGETAGPGVSPSSRAEADHRGAILASVARAFGIALDTLLHANPTIHKPDGIVIGEAIHVPGATWTQSARNGEQPLIRWGDRLDAIARLVGVPVQDLAHLNNIADPNAWIYDGRPLWLPAGILNSGQIAASAGARPTSDGDAAGPAVETPDRDGSPAARLAADEGFYVHSVASGETLLDLATRFDTTVAQLLADNAHLAGDELTGRETILVRRPLYTKPDEAQAAFRPDAQPAVALVSRLDAPGVISGSGLDGRVSTAERTGEPLTGATRTGSTGSGAPPGARTDGAALVAKYGGQTWPSLEAMPAEVRRYFVATLDEVAAFFNVRPGDIAGILRAEQNNRGWTLHEPGVSTAGARGVAQVVARTWNGWSNPRRDGPSPSLAEIERYGGLGFDWAARAQWRAWQQGRLPLTALAATNADPGVFENGVAAIARHLLHWGLTREAAARDPAAFQARLADAVAVYNSGRPLAVSREFTQSAANRKTVGSYVAEVLATAAAWPAAAPAPAPGRHGQRPGRGGLEPPARRGEPPRREHERGGAPGRASGGQPRPGRARAPGGHPAGGGPRDARRGPPPLRGLPFAAHAAGSQTLRQPGALPDWRPPHRHRRGRPGWRPALRRGRRRGDLRRPALLRPGRGLPRAPRRGARPGPPDLRDLLSQLGRPGPGWGPGHRRPADRPPGLGGLRPAAQSGRQPPPLRGPRGRALLRRLAHALPRRQIRRS
ncbi:MAG: LysM peptidoglycan-binding domain-containing protein [Ardenticatenaceae bacterium]|nr:LysM peptidoglycan-binding domain-containing protein [Ardenticatenaceae bacterium]